MNDKAIETTLDRWASHLEVTKKENKVVVDNNKAKGYIEAIAFEELDVLKLELYLKQDLPFRHPNLGHLPYIRMSFLMPLEEKIVEQKKDVQDPTELYEYSESGYGVYVTNSSRSFKIDFKKRPQLRILELRISKDLFRSFTSQSKKLQNLMPQDDYFVVFEELDPKGRWMFDTVFSTTEKDYYYLERIKTTTFGLLTHFFICVNSREVIEASNKYPFNMDAVLQTQNYLYENSDRVVTINEVSKEVGLSESRLRYLFKQVFGVSIMSYHQDVRLHQSKEILKSLKVPISAIALDFGFNSASHYTTSFKKKFKLTPKEFQEKYTAQFI
ncbi:AraC family transcriptional regulator [Flammeovirga sp. SubArs3]|uniref:helix-turn-helix domain-containing protein n=1 Tax=Flammeovirga sp. SubArs3 TaxID=2995316 RepID=UPI00248BF838|nr:AraC family transcriptional regulator [Flammeovirga sp. SubArs3]